MHKQTGFTLVELSIALVIIGLITGGVLVGKDLIRAAELRKFYSEKDAIVLSANTFKAKYNCMAGDCAKATDFFGTDPEGCPEYEKTPKSETCNGNGSDAIDGEVLWADAPLDYIEKAYFWQHLSAAGLWPGSFNGSFLHTDFAYVDKNTYPAVRIDPALGWAVMATPDRGVYVSTYGNDDMGEVAQPAYFFTPEEMMLFDQKYDDGRPASGAIRPTAWLSSNCTNPNTFPMPANAVYDTSYKDKQCSINFLGGF